MLLLVLVSVSLNILLFWYNRKLINFIKFTTSEMTDLHSSIDSYKEHLNKVYGLETFYGDNTLQSLLSHTKQLNSDVGDFIQINEELLYGEENA